MSLNKTNLSNNHRVEMMNNSWATPNRVMSACIWHMISWIPTSWQNVTHCIRVNLVPTQTSQLVIWVTFLPQAKVTTRRDTNLHLKDSRRVIWRPLSLRLIVVSWRISRMRTKFTIIDFQEGNRVRSPKSQESKQQSMANIPEDVKMAIKRRCIPRLLYHNNFRPLISKAAKIKQITTSRVQNNLPNTRKLRPFLRWVTHPSGPIISQH